MIRAAFLSFYRSLTRHPLYSALNLLGLSFGIAVFIVLSLFVRFETSYEQWLPNADRIYVVAHRSEDERKAGRPYHYSSAGYAFDAIRNLHPELAATRIFPDYITVRKGNVLTEETGQLVDPDFFMVFDIPVVAGNRDAALSASDGLILSERMARKYFGRSNVVGERLFLREDTVGSARQEKEKSWQVLAVLQDIPKNSNLRLDIIRGVEVYRATEGLPYSWNLWGEGQRGMTFVQFPTAKAEYKLGVALSSAIKAFSPSDDFVTLHTTGYRETMAVALLSFRKEHLSNRHLRYVVTVLEATATLTLIVAFVNYSNLTIATMGLRTKEAAIRSIYGAHGGRLFGQFVFESLIAGGAGLILALSLVEVGIGSLNKIGQLALVLDYYRDYGVMGGMAITVLFGGFLAGLYPAGVFSGFHVADVLGKVRSFVMGRPVRRCQDVLVVAQFAVVIIFFIIIIGFAAELKHMEASDLGFSRDNLFVTDDLVGLTARPEISGRIVRAWRQTPGVIGVTQGRVPGPYYMISVQPVSRRLLGAPEVELGFAWMAPQFFEIYRTPLLAGRPIAEADDVALVPQNIKEKKVTINVVLNAAATTQLGFSEPQKALGQSLVYGFSTLHVVGVVADQRFQGPLKSDLPMVYFVNSFAAAFQDTIVRYSGIEEAVARQRLMGVWRKIIPERPLKLTTIREELDYYYRDDRRNTRLFAIGGGVAALIGAVGLFGMAAFNTSARVHEIGIRKAQGASRWRIMRLLMFQFLRPVLIANIIAWPIAYVVLDGWLKQFDDRVAMSPLFFLAGSGLSILIAAVTVFGVAWSGASLSPAKALRQL